MTCIQNFLQTQNKRTYLSWSFTFPFENFDSLLAQNQGMNELKSLGHKKGFVKENGLHATVKGKRENLKLNFLSQSFFLQLKDYLYPRLLKA